MPQSCLDNNHSNEDKGVWHSCITKTSNATRTSNIVAFFFNNFFSPIYKSSTYIVLSNPRSNKSQEYSVLEFLKSTTNTPTHIEHESFAYTSTHL
mmetsp:Transcript_21574/g.45202  ORF Transcript_21574/g.45202 Transcript_21574/m.45202 type:complete len:95 (+) Transcript_21574:172-456(+)